MLNKKYYNDIIVKNDKFTVDTTIALGLVKKYICSNNLLIVGGMAIDFALRLKGSSLYEDGILPDYDFYSPEYNTDAYKIAEKLKNAGLENITVINANHISTMRVRVNYTVVADVTYIPKKIFDNLPFLVYRDIRFIHPHFQLIDQHRSLSRPYENSPWEVILYRWEKDIVRYDMIYKYYPLKSKDFISSKIKLTDEIIINSIDFTDQCISGFAGLLYWIHMAKKLGYKNNNVNLGKITLDSGGFIVQIPEKSNGLSIYSNNIIQLSNDIKKENSDVIQTQYKRFLDKLPHKFLLKFNLNKLTNISYEIFDNGGSMIGAHKTNIGIYIDNLQNIMLYMLTNILINTIDGDLDNKSYIYYIGYITAQSIVKWACDNYKLTCDKNIIPFLPTACVYGNNEISDSYINSKRQFLEAIGERKICQVQPKIIFPEMFVENKIPDIYYKFDPTKSPILQFDGEITDIYINRVYIK
jgi:hypothetical protein